MELRQYSSCPYPRADTRWRSRDTCPVPSLTLFHDLAARGTPEVLFRVGCTGFATLLASGSVFGNARLHVLWGWGLAFTKTARAALCILEFRGTALILGLLGSVVAALGGCLLLLDSSVREYRERLGRRFAT